MMEFRPGRLAGVGLVIPAVHRDRRGFFAETFDSEQFSALGLEPVWPHDSVSMSTLIGTVRGMHFQVPPRTQAKLVQVTRGEVFDVVVDLRVGSPTYRMTEVFELSESALELLYVPVGFAHGFVTRRSDTEVRYKMSDRYSPDHSSGVLWSSVDVDWGVEDVIISERDSSWPPVSTFDSPFRWPA